MTKSQKFAPIITGFTFIAVITALLWVDKPLANDSSVVLCESDDGNKKMVMFDESNLRLVITNPYNNQTHYEPITKNGDANGWVIVGTQNYWFGVNPSENAIMLTKTNTNKVYRCKI